MMSHLSIIIVIVAVSPIATCEVERRIVGGEYAVINEYPHLGLITGKCGQRSRWICGASILNQKILLTAAHCFCNCNLNRRKHRLAVFFGSTYMSSHPMKQFLSDHLRKAYQKVRSPKSCSRYGRMYKGMFCAGKMGQAGDYPFSGDSGSALVTRNRYHQIGLVSFGWVLYPAMTVYTNVSYYHGWITRNAKRLYCNKTAR